MIEIKIDQYTTLKLEDSGQYGYKLIEGWIDKEGSFKPQFCKRRFKKDGEEKNAPVSVKLGNKETAINTLTQMLNAIGGNPEDVPF